MQKLIDYIMQHTIRGACQCGKCADAPPEPEKHQPTGHTADLIFFKCAAKDNPDADTLRGLIADIPHGEYSNMKPLDGQEHSYIELGAWIGSQDAALRLMGLGAILGLWKLLTPRTMLQGTSDEIALKMAGMGYVTFQAV